MTIWVMSMTNEKWYEVLGLPVGASGEEIKKAYFRLVRKHSPESDPKKFQEIRHAYEELKKTGGEQKGPIYPEVDDPFKKIFLDTITDNMEKMRYEKMMQSAMEAYEQFPEEERFAYYYVYASRMNGNTGKAVKMAEQLVKVAPQNKWYHRELAFAYHNRTWKNKALTEALQAEEMGCKDMELLALLSEIYIDCENYEGALDKTCEMMAEDRKLEDHEIDLLLNQVAAIKPYYLGYGDSWEWELGVTRSEISLQKLLQALAPVIEKNSVRMKKGFEMICHLMLENLPGPEDSITEVIALVRRILATIDRYKHSPEEIYPEWSFNEWLLGLVTIDDRLSEETKKVIANLIGNDPSVQEFQWLNARLVILENIDHTRDEIPLLKSDYPEIGAEVAEYAESMNSPELVKETHQVLMQRYMSQMDSYSHGMYEYVYPEKYQALVEKKKAKGVGSFDNPYVRSEKKVGRNDPCPCGSGKKYKFCHGRK